MKNYIAARSVSCNCLFCKTCLIQKEILYAIDSVITQRQAKKEGLRCSSCNCLLHLQKDDKPVKQKKNAFSESIP